MKNFWFLSILGALLLMSSCSVPNAGSGFYQAHKHKKGVRNFTVPGWLIYTGTGFAHDIIKEDDVKALMHIAKRVKKMQFMLDEGNGAIAQTDVRAFQEHLRRRNFDDLIYVRSEETTVSLMVHSKKDKLRDLVVIVHAEEDFVFLNMRTNIKVKHLAELIETIMRLDNKDAEEEKPIPTAPAAEKPVVRPRA